MAINNTHTGNRIDFDVLFQYAAIGILIADQEERILLANPCLLNLSGYTPDELTGREVTLLIPPGNNFYEGQPAARKTQLLCHDGNSIPVEVSSHEENSSRVIFIKDLSGQAVLQEALHAQSEVLDSTRNELALQARIIASQDRSITRTMTFINSIWQNTPAIMMVLGPQGEIQWFNKLAEQSLGYPQEQVRDHHKITLFLDPAQMETRAAEFSGELGYTILPGTDTLFARANRDLPNEYEWDYIRRDGSRFPVQLEITAIRIGGPNITNYVAIALDISQRKQAQKDLQAALEKEKELNLLKSRFVSLASHEFRTPLSTIKSSTYLLSKYETTADHPKRQVHTNRIISSVNMLSDILNDVLSVGIIEEGRIQVRNASVAIKKTVQDIVLDLEGVKKEQQQIICTHEGEESAYLDPTLLKHIVMNLVSNAIKFSPGDGTITVNSCCNSISGLTLSVQDEGIGIPEEDRQHLFERFFRGSNVSGIQGTGLGLHIVSKYAELMKGNVTCESTAGKGTTFVVNIPSPQN